MEHNLNKIRTIFAELNIAWVEPYMTTVEEVLSEDTGMHRGLYWIMPENNFYFGLAASEETLIATKRMDTHILKLTVDLATLYGAKGKSTEPKVEPYKKFPEGWKEAVRKYIIEDTGPIPSHWTPSKHPSKKKWCVPGVLEFPVKFKVDPYKINALIWNLDHLTPEQIEAIEKLVIKTIWPYANNETYKKRKKGLING